MASWDNNLCCAFTFIIKAPIFLAVLKMVDAEMFPSHGLETEQSCCRVVPKPLCFWQRKRSCGHPGGPDLRAQQVCTCCLPEARPVLQDHLCGTGMLTALFQALFTAHVNGQKAFLKAMMEGL